MRLLTEKEVAEILKVTPQTLRKWRSLNVGPSYLQFNAKAVRYEMGTLIEWLQSKKKITNSKNKR